MQTIEINEETYNRLTRIAVPFKDTTPESVIIKLLDDYESNQTKPRPPSEVSNATRTSVANSLESWWTDSDPGISIDNPFEPPSLKHTKVLRAKVDGKDVPKANWTTVRQSVLTIAFDRGYNVRGLLEICAINAVEGSKGDEGYRHYPELGVSIQGQDANHAWRVTAAVAKELGVSVKVSFQWRVKPDAKYPGKRSVLTLR